MKNDVLSAFQLHTHWLHQSLTGRLTIARVDVDVLAPQTLRAMIGVAAAAHGKTTLLAGKVFSGSFKFFCDASHSDYLYCKYTILGISV